MNRILVTGANGFVGSAVCKALFAHGYAVVGLVRSEDAADTLADAGIQAIIGDVNDERTLSEAIAQVDGVIHTAFNHNFATFQQNCQDDYRVIQIMGESLKGTDKPLVITSGAFSTGNEVQSFLPAPYINSGMLPRALSDESALQCAAQGINVRLIGLTQVHNTAKFGLVNYLFDVAQKQAVAAFVGEGSNRWSGVHIDDVATLYRLVLEKGRAGYKYYASAGEAMTLRDIAQQVGSTLSLPVTSIPASQAAQHFGPLSHLVQASLYVDEPHTREHLGWQPSGPSFAEDLANNTL